METNHPTLDTEALGNMSAEERAAAIDAYMTSVTEAARAQAAAQFADELAQSRYAAAKYRLLSEEALPDFAARLPAIEKLIGEMPMLAGLCDEDRLRTAYYLDRGMQPQTPPDAETLVAAVQKNAEALRILEASVLEKLRACDAPPMAATAGNATAPVTPPKKPTSLDEASALARAAFGV